jgi:hypothetical protein
MRITGRLIRSTGLCAALALPVTSACGSEEGGLFDGSGGGPSGAPASDAGGAGATGGSGGIPGGGGLPAGATGGAGGSSSGGSSAATGGVATGGGSTGGSTTGGAPAGGAAGAAGAGGAPACDDGMSRCDGACVDTESSASHCGECGHPCLPGSTCESGTCGPVMSDCGLASSCNELCATLGDGRECVDGGCDGLTGRLYQNQSCLGGAIGLIVSCGSSFPGSQPPPITCCCR